ncbi:hypothetical protein ABENE_18010 [Asticcacaulis benevestitus DSM 16100 = ATCC BAA-896]|uniref:Uncharacterized protein n=1 Tax=Asticcacaulis benevestitus DSM 16100 = ATCC BAA-896 TaxID=1121022 RepID=V4R5H9_9CAUL|nr:hypothetical protein ABENE_18010 [Asticcacaulis benevestitus DSM 16100 = ATCC BAA-896]
MQPQAVLVTLHPFWAALAFSNKLVLGLEQVGHVIEAWLSPGQDTGAGLSPKLQKPVLCELFRQDQVFLFGAYAPAITAYGRSHPPKSTFWLPVKLDFSTKNFMRRHCIPTLFDPGWKR